MKKKSSRLTKAILSTAKDMHEAGILDAVAYKKITMRHLENENPSTLEPKKRLKESIQQSKEGKGRVISSAELDEMVRNGWMKCRLAGKT